MDISGDWRDSQVCDTNLTMNDWLGQIKVLVWDVDGTLYRATEASFRVVREAEYQVIMHHTGWNRERTMAEFNKIYRVQTPSGTKTVVILSGITASQAAIECEWYFDRTQFVKRDRRLTQMFEKLQDKKHIVFSNSDKSKLVKALQQMGLGEKIFTRIITPEDTQVLKPDLVGFKYVLEHTGEPAEAHLMIGDRVSTDVIPAKKVGMHTCLVWPTEPGDAADITLPTVYDVGSLF